MIFFLNGAQNSTDLSLISFFLEAIRDILIAVISSSILYYIVQKNLNAINVNRALKMYGIQKIKYGGKIGRKNFNKICKNAQWVKMCYAAADSLINDYYQTIAWAVNRSKNPLKIKVLFCKPYNPNVIDIERIEIEYGTRDPSDSISTRIMNSKKYLDAMEAHKPFDKRNIEVRINENLYFFPYLIAYFPPSFYNKKGVYKAYLNLSIPPRKAKTSVCITGTATEKDKNRCTIPQKDGSIFLDSEKANIVVDLESHFDHIWRKNQKFNAS